MSPRKNHIFSIDVAKESLRQGRLVIESLPNLSRTVRRIKGEYLDGVTAGRIDVSDIVQNPRFHFSYGANGISFYVVVYERKRHYIPGDMDGISVSQGGNRGYVPARFDDLPAPVRKVAQDIQAALNFQDTSADKARKARHARQEKEWSADMQRRNPKWFDADGNLDRTAMSMDMKDLQAKIAEYDAKYETRETE